MAYEVITLNLIPSGDVPVIHAAQYDKNRPLNFALKLGDDDFNPSGYDLELQIRKVDNNIVTVAPSTVNNNVVTFLSTEQMTACSGTNLGEIQITKDLLDIATLHFYLVVQRDVLAGGMTSASDIHNLEEQIEELLPEALGDQYYTKDQTNTLLDGKADISDIPDMSDYYTKSETYSIGEVNTLLSAKANTSDLATVATSGNYNDLSNKPTIPAAQVNADWDAVSGVAMILNKPTIPAAQVQSDWNQSDNTKVDYIKNKPTVPVIETVTIENTAIATFPDGADNVPLSALEVEIEPNLSGVSSVTITNKDDLDNPTQTDTYTVSLGGTYYGGMLDVKNKTITKTCDCELDLSQLTWTLQSTANRFVSSGISSLVKRPLSNDDLLDDLMCAIYTPTAANNTSGSSAIDNTIGITTTGNIVIRDTSLYGDITALQTKLSNQKLTYPLKTPIFITGLSDTDIRTLLGNNNIFADSGDIEKVTYFKIGCESIARLIEAYM